MKILSQIYVGDNKFLLSLLGDTKDLSNLPTEYAADASRFLNTDSNAVYVYTSADGWEITEAGQMKDLPVVSATDNGKVLKVANGVWSIGTDESGGSLLANFPAEGAANANKYIGFDENGDYAAVTAPAVVYINADFSLETMQISNADKTYGEIIAAIAANDYCVLRLSFTNRDDHVMRMNVPIRSQIVQTGGTLYFDTLMVADLGDGEASYLFEVALKRDDTIFIDFAHKLTSTAIST